MDSSISLSFLVPAWQTEKYTGYETCLLSGCALSFVCGTEIASKITVCNELDKWVFFFREGKFTRIITLYVTPVLPPYMNVLILK